MNVTAQLGAQLDGGAVTSPSNISSIEDLSISSLTKSYDGQAPVLRDISFKIRRGEAVALVGANGTGKSTLMRCCLRLIEPDTGGVEMLGTDITGLSRKALRDVRAQAGFIFQRHNLVPRFSALSNVVHGAQAWARGPRTWHQALASKAVREEAMYCLDLVGLADFAKRRVDQLSGGQSQRVAIARALMQRPRIMLADEPVASLDPKAGEEVMELFVRLIKSQGLTLFYSSHHLEHAIGYSDRILGLRGGVVALDGASNGQNVNSLRGIYD